MDVRGLRRALIGLSAAVAVVVGTSAAYAAPVVGVTIDATNADTGVASGHYDPGLLDTTASSGGNYVVSGLGYDASFQCTWDLTVNPDPQITSTFTLTNISGSTQNFVMTVTLPIATISPTTKQGGYFGDPSTGTTYTDTGGAAGVTLATVGATPFYQAVVNTVLSQGLGSFSSSAAVSGNVPQQQWGTPIPNAAFGTAAGNIQIKWNFSLTAGDQVQTKGFFQVEAPEPGSALLVGMGLAALALVRRRSA
jgi:hypothetical protein